eukprot:NODE_93_length_21530_cov_0.700387.p9 type:complete len:361 gc:universal NODE_93_length_21530_cov_0.700387:15088-14006(-)
MSKNLVLPIYKRVKQIPKQRRQTLVDYFNLHKWTQLFLPYEKKETSTNTLKKITVIGIHGWFPNSIMQRVLGEPTGTSSKFAEMMTSSLNEWSKDEKQEIEITSITLECQGQIEFRVESHFDELILHAKTIMQSDEIFIATHSQGTPVSMMLIAKLIHLGIISHQKCCILAMAGISHGPFPYLQSYTKIMEDNARELFDFNNPNSPVSKRYYEAIEDVLNANVKIVFVSSWFDQVVPLYSSLASGLHHKNVLRALYVDHEGYDDQDFLLKLVLFAVKLRNKQINDKDLFVYLSDLIAGALLGTGHSTLYEESSVFRLAIDFLHSPEILGSRDLKIDAFEAPTKLNMYHLPWSIYNLFSTS